MPGIRTSLPDRAVSDWAPRLKRWSLWSVVGLFAVYAGAITILDVDPMLGFGSRPEVTQAVSRGEAGAGAQPLPEEEPLPEEPAEQPAAEAIEETVPDEAAAVSPGDAPDAASPADESSLAAEEPAPSGEPLPVAEADPRDVQPADDALPPEEAADRSADAWLLDAEFDSDDPRGAPAAVRPRPMPPKVLRFARRVVEQHDESGSGVLDPEEWQAITPNLAAADLDGDGVITSDELAQYMAAYGARRTIRLITPPPEEDGSPGATGVERWLSGAPNGQPGRNGRTRTPSGEPQRPEPRFVPRRHPDVPDWFYERDLDGDGQLTLAEYAVSGTRAEMEEFARYDLNNDGVLTPEEFLRARRLLAEGKLPAALADEDGYDNEE